MPLAMKLTGGAALALLTLVPNHQLDDQETGIRFQLGRPSTTLVSLANDFSSRNQAEALAEPIYNNYRDKSKQEQRKSLRTAINKFENGKELSYGQSFNLINSFKSYNSGEFLKFLTQLQRDITNPETQISRKLSRETKDHLTLDLASFLKTMQDRAKANNGKTKFTCSDVIVLRKLNEIRPEQKAIILKEFKNHAFLESRPTRTDIFALANDEIHRF